MEILDIVDEENKLINKKQTRQYIHENNLWHRHVSCWIINDKGEVLLQRRSKDKKKNSNMWSKTGGHVLADENPIDALKRELKEELGISVNDKNIILIGVYKSNDEKNKYFSYEYIVQVKYKIDDYQLQIEELSEVKYITIDEMIHLKKIKDKNYTFCKWKEDDFYKLYLVNLLLSSSASEILLNKLRKENNLVYTCGSSVLIRNGLLLIKALTNKNSIKLVSMLIESIIKELSDIDKYKDNINNIIRRLSLDIEREKDNFYISTANIINEYYECDISSEEELEVIKNISNEELLDLINRLELCSMYTLEGSCG